MNNAIVVSAFFVLTKGGLISRNISILLNSLKEGAKKYPEHYPSEEKNAQDIEVLQGPRRHLQ